MDETDLFRLLIRQEKILHRPLYRNDKSVLNTLLHTDFFEFCRSGVSTDKKDTVGGLNNPVTCAQQIYSENYHCARISSNSVLMTYRSFQFAGEKCIKATNRTSLWTETTHDHWQLRFHQGTPSEREQ
ncbi:MAG TPA: ribonuclease H [Morganella sp. (in: Bacteria)]|nr:ribonuclease H [Morganella sp. (in: enterobacteria)]